jgi:hypothetical protein
MNDERTNGYRVFFGKKAVCRHHEDYELLHEDYELLHEDYELLHED